jgi:hypothetical protein
MDQVPCRDEHPASGPPLVAQTSSEIVGCPVVGSSFPPPSGRGPELATADEATLVVDTVARAVRA